MKQHEKKKSTANSLWTILLPLLVFIALGVFFAIERAGIAITEKDEPVSLTFLPEELLIPRINRNLDKRCLIIWDSSVEHYPRLIENVSFVLDDMSVGHSLFDIEKNREASEFESEKAPVMGLPSLREYKTIILILNDLKPIYPVLEEIFDWVNSGGGLLFANPPDDRILTTYFHSEMGVQSGEYDFIPQVDAILETDLLAGGRGAVIPLSDRDPVQGFREGVGFKLNKSSIVHITSTGPDGPTPMLWENHTGAGKVVVNNNDAYLEKWSRGLIAAAYSLTEAAIAWPVINASVFYIDDFPAPIPEGYNDYIRKEFGVQTEYFFVHIWFPDMMRLANKHKIKYSSVFIESYDDVVEPPFERMEDTERMKYFGALFLNEGHEIGLHGHNHQSLVLENFDYRGILPYNKWKSEEDMAAALKLTVELHDQLFPGNVMRTYVPTSNVLSVEGRAVLKNYFPEINVISGLFFDGDFGIQDDFGIGEDGLINIPRLAAGYYPLEEYDGEYPFWSILNELNFHFINSHFIHPDDPMDPERGAEKGWKNLYKSFEEFLILLGGFPLRNMTAQQAAPAVQRFYNLTAHTTLKNNEIALDLDGFVDEAYLFVRINEAKPRQTSGGVLTHVSENLYLLKAVKNRVVINLEPAPVAVAAP